MQWVKRQQLLLYSLILVGMVELGPIIRGALSLLGLLGSFDFVLSRSENPGWVGKMLRVFLEPPAGLQALFLLAGIYLLWLYERRRNATIYEPKLPESERLSIRLARTQDQVATLLARQEQMNANLQRAQSHIETSLNSHQDIMRQLQETKNSIPRTAILSMAEALEPYLRALANIAFSETRNSTMDVATRHLYVEIFFGIINALDESAKLSEGLEMRANHEELFISLPMGKTLEEIWGDDLSKINRALLIFRSMPGMILLKKQRSDIAN